MVKFNYRATLNNKIAFKPNLHQYGKSMTFKWIKFTTMKIMKISQSRMKSKVMMVKFKEYISMARKKLSSATVSEERLFLTAIPSSISAMMTSNKLSQMGK